MTITIVKVHSGLRSNDITWTITGSCYYSSSCEDCEFGKLINFTYSEFPCLRYREQLINYTSKNLLPYTFDTDDYPEFLI